MKLTNYPFITRIQTQDAALSLFEPLMKKLSAGCARLHLGDTGAVYPSSTADMEAYSRQLWALVPLMMGKSEKANELFEKFAQGLRSGTNPAHPEYWGKIGPFDQHMVEMAAIATGLIFLPDAFYRSFDEEARINLYSWLNQINDYDMPQNNWRFFRVLVNTAFRLIGLEPNQQKLEEDFKLIEEHYEADGWYYDYMNQREYYTPWAYHYYGLLYSVAMKDLDPQRCALYQERARLFAPRFAMWFANDGEALPYGRSLTYRFAQCSFYAAMAFSGVTAEGIGYGEMKHLVLSNLRKWFSRPIFTQEGLLSIGYGYPNLLMGEGYNAPGSPYWANKAFLCMALPEDHPFWTCEEKTPVLPERLYEEHARMLITRDARGRDVKAYTAGNHCTEHSHDEAKYEKFVYSTHFSISVPKSLVKLKSGAFDCVLAVSLDGVFYHPRYGNENYEITEEGVAFTWHPYPFTTIRTQIKPMGDWHQRTHHINTTQLLYLAEGGFSIKREEGQIRAELDLGEKAAVVYAPWGISGVKSIQGFEKADIIATEPNTNLLYNRTWLPTLLGNAPIGDSTFASLICGSPLADRLKWEEAPNVI